MSTLVAQLTVGSYFSATSSSPLVAVERIAKAIAIEVNEGLRFVPPMFRSARIISLTPS